MSDLVTRTTNSKLSNDFAAMSLKDIVEDASENTDILISKKIDDPSEIVLLTERVSTQGECLIRLSHSVDDYQRPCGGLTISNLDPHFKTIHITDDYYLVRSKRDERDLDAVPDIRVAVVGNVDAGKSTTLGVLTRGNLDDGRGSARYNRWDGNQFKPRATMFRHAHEKESGRTSSIGQEIVGARDGALVHGDKWQGIVDESQKIGSNAGMVGMTKEHLALTISLAIPLLVIITKVDQTPGEVKEGTLRQLSKLLKSTPRIPIVIRTLREACTVMKGFVGNTMAPIFQISNVTGEGVETLKRFLALLPSKTIQSGTTATEFCVTETYVVAGVGTVVAGTLLCGTIKLGDSLLLGPDTTGAFLRTTIKGIQKKKVNCDVVSATTACSLALKKVKRNQIRKGTVLVNSAMCARVSECGACREFEADVLVLFHSTTITCKYQAMLHCGVIRQTVKIVAILTPAEETANAEDERAVGVLRTGDRRRVRFRFLWSPEWVKVGQRLLFREGRTKGVGKVTRVIPIGQIQ